MLLVQVDLDSLVKRLPVAYQHALFSSWLVSHFIYNYSINTTAMNLLHFCKGLAVKSPSLTPPTHLTLTILGFNAFEKQGEQDSPCWSKDRSIFKVPTLSLAPRVTCLSSLSSILCS